MFNNILVATDFSDSSRAALFEAIDLARLNQSRIHALHVVTYLEDIFRAARYPIPDTKWRKSLQERIEKFFPKSLYLNSRRHTLIGGAIAEEILNFASAHQCNLIVTGTHGRRALGRLLMGSVTNKLLRESRVPVMVVPEQRNEMSGLQIVKRILVAMDLSSTSTKVVRFAVQFASLLQAEIHLIHVIDPPSIETSKTFQLSNVIDETCELNVDSTLHEMLDEYKLITEPIVRTCVGNTAQEILRYAAEENCNYIVMGTRCR
ncbi:MAG TPA: universal stress protein, partial [Acidobacteriota bacterium]|nr:universal stress protein [Acidobacteriota bacterium]